MNKMFLVLPLILVGCNSTQYQASKYPNEVMIAKGVTLSNEFYVEAISDTFGSEQAKNMLNQMMVYTDSSNSGEISLLATLNDSAKPAPEYAKNPMGWYVTAYDLTLNELKSDSEVEIIKADLGDDCGVSEASDSDYAKFSPDKYECQLKANYIVESKDLKSGQECAVTSLPILTESNGLQGIAVLSTCSPTLSSSQLAAKIKPTLDENIYWGSVSKQFMN